MGVVDAFEVVQVHQHQRQRLAGALGTVHLLCHQIDPAPPVSQPGERVLGGHQAQGFPELVDVGDIFDRHPRANVVSVQLVQRVHGHLNGQRSPLLHLQSGLETDRLPGRQAVRQGLVHMLPHARPNQASKVWLMRWMRPVLSRLQ
jgi:hypothetical protein